MGISGLTKLINDNAPGATSDKKFETYFGRKIAVDASNHIYQYMAVVGRMGDQMLSNEAGETTSHLQGMFYRTVKMLEAGIQPVYVFDGKAPELKKATLAARRENKDDATEALAKAREAGNVEDIEKYSKRAVRVTKEHNDDCKKLLRLLGVPVVEAPSEAEAQCAVMAKAGLVYGVATEDMDALTFGSPRLIRHLMSTAKDAAATEFDLHKILEGLGLTMEAFVDMCIMCGCDYVNNIRGIGPVRALALIQKNTDIETVLETLDSAKYPLPENFPFKEARQYFLEPEVLAPDEMPPLKWPGPDEEGVVAFLVGEKGFAEDRVRKGIKRVMDNKSKSNQSRMESFFKPVPKVAAPQGGAAGPSKVESGGAKRKDVPKGAPAAAAKKGKQGVGGGKKK